jgi:hypothetical protein
MPAHCRDDRPPLLIKDDDEEEPAHPPLPGPERTPIAMPAMTAACRYDSYDLGELLRQAAAMAAAMTRKP